jgi:hypothetical protein
MELKIQCHFTALFNFEPLDKGYPFNLRFGLNPKRPVFDGSGPGLYFISIGEEVVYIGSYKSEKDSIISVRFSKHIQTISFRGNRVGFPSGIQNLAHLIEITNFDFLNEFEPNNFEGRFRDTGVVASMPKIRIANNYWNTHLINFDQNSDLQFHYYKFAKNYDTNNLKNDEMDLILQINPIGNDQWNMGNPTIDLAETIQIFENY